MDQRFEVMLEPLRVFLAQIGDFLPRLLLALIVLIAGWLIAKMVRFAISRGLRKVNFHVITDRAGIDGFLKDGGIRMDATDILAMLVYWIVILVALVVGFNLLGLTYVTELLSKVLLFVPKVSVAKSRTLDRSSGTYVRASRWKPTTSATRNTIEQT